MPTEPTEPTEPTLRHLFDAPQPDHQIDVAAIVRRSRARRAPKVWATAGASVFAVGGILLGGIQFAGGVEPSLEIDAGSAADESTLASPEGAMSDAGDGVKRWAASEMNLCGASVVEPAQSDSGLVFSVDFADASVGSDIVNGTVTMTNTGTQSWFGYTAAEPTITLAQNGIVVWHSNGPMIELAREVNLAPGKSLEYTASFVPVICAPEDEGEFRTDLPAAPVGEYQVSAAIDLMGEFDAQLITGPPRTVTLR